MIDVLLTPNLFPSSNVSSDLEFNSFSIGLASSSFTCHNEVIDCREILTALNTPSERNNSACFEFNCLI